MWFGPKGFASVVYGLLVIAAGSWLFPGTGFPDETGGPDDLLDDLLGHPQLVGPRRRRLDGTERGVVDVHELPQLGEVATHQGEVVAFVETPDPEDPVATVAVAPLQAAMASAGTYGMTLWLPEFLYGS